MSLFPSVKINDIDEFEIRLDAFLSSASRPSILAAVQRAAKFLEDEAEDVGLDMTHVNNATSTLCRSVNVLSNRLVTAEKRIKELEAAAAPANPNFKFQVRDRDWPSSAEWGPWEDADEAGHAEMLDEDGYLILALGGFDELIHQVRVVFLPEES